jgi:TP901 family phage tail tape measure protein
MAMTAADLVVKMSADTKDAERGMQRMSKGISGFAKHAAAVGTGVLGAMVFRGIAHGFQGATSAALDFGAQMANVNSIAQLSDGAFAKLNDQVLALTSDPRIAQAPATLAAGLYDIYSSGFQGADGMKVLQQSALAATAGITDTATSARAITSVLNAFSLGAEDSQRVSDVLFQTVNDGVITFEQLANNLGNVIPIANSLGLTVEEVGAAYAQMTLKGVNASQAETQIAGLMRAAVNPTDALTEAVQAHGYASASAAIESKGLAGFLDIVNDAAGGNQETMFNLLGTQEAMNAATILGANNTKGYRKELDKMKGASKGAGATNKALEQQMKSASFQIAKMKQQVLTLATVGFGILAPTIGKVAGVMTKFIGRTLIPFAHIIGRATSANFTFGKGFDKLLKSIPEPLRRTVHAIASFTDSLSDMWRHGFSRNEMTQAFHAVQALGEEFGQAVHWTFNVLADAAVSLGSLLLDGIKAAPGAIWDWIKGKIMGTGAGAVGDATGGPSPAAGKSVDFGTVAITAAVKLGGAIARLAGHLWDWVKGQLIGGAGSVSQDPAAGGYAGTGQSIDMGDWVLNVAAPGISSAVGDLGAWVNRYLFNQTNNQDVGPISWALVLAPPNLEFQTDFGSAQRRADYIKSHIPPLHLRDIPLYIQLVPQIVANLPVLTFAAAQSAIVLGLSKLPPVRSLIEFSPQIPLTAYALLPQSIRSGIEGAAAKVGKVNVSVDMIVDLTIDVVQHVKTGAEGIWDFLTGHITPLSGGGMPKGMGIVGPENVQVASNLSITATLDKTQWDTDYQAVFEDVAAINGTTATAFVTMDRTAWESGYQTVYKQVNDINRTTAIATADLDINPFTDNYDVIRAPGGLGDQIESAYWTATADLDIGPFTIAYTNAFAAGYAWANSVFTATFAIDTSGLWGALAVAQIVAAEISAIMPHSPAKKGPLSKPVSFGFIADAARRDLAGIGASIEGYLGMRGRRGRFAHAPVHAGPHTVNINITESKDARMSAFAVRRELTARGLIT